jgi:1,2-phenylacetyl-CoA epoxidase catalytic subunit
LAILESALAVQLRGLAEAEIVGADLYARVFYPLTKDATEKMLCCRHAAEKWAHHLALTEALRDMGVEASDLARHRFEDRRFGSQLIGSRSWTWPDCAAYAALAEAATLWQFQCLPLTADLALAEVLPQVQREEEDHVAEGWRILRGLCGSLEGRRRAQEAVSRVWPAVLHALGYRHPEETVERMPDDAGTDGCTDTRQSFIVEQQTQLGWLGLRLSPVSDP